VLGVLVAVYGDVDELFAQDGTSIELDAGVYRVDVLRMHAPPHLVTIDVFPLEPDE
jgi:hypothetical protein